MNENEREGDHDPVAALLRATPPAPVSADFLTRVNARIDETAGWLGLADFRAWTLGLVPAAAVLVLLAILWPAAPAANASPLSATPAQAQVVSSQTFTPSSYSDWEQDVTANALLEAALRGPASAGVDRRN
jgi:hypothetical protein